MLLRIVGEFKRRTVKTLTAFWLFTLYYTMSTFDALEEKKPFENIVEKEENAGYQHFLLFPQCFLSWERQLKCF